VTNGVPYVEYEPNLGGERKYTVKGCENLGDGWHDRRPGDRFFKVDVSMP